MNDNFNKEKFSRILEKSKGNRTITKYSKDSGVSTSHISRLLRGLLNNPPSPEIISKLAEKPHNGVSYKDLLEAAGHIGIIDSKEEIEIYSPVNSRNLALELERELFQIILEHLYDQPYKWSIEKPEGGILRPDMIVAIEGDCIWYLEFRLNISGSSHRPMPLGLMLSLYGRVALTKLSRTDKFTIVVDNESDLATLMQNQPLNLRANLYVMLVDLESRKIVREEKISEY